MQCTLVKKSLRLFDELLVHCEISKTEVENVVKE